MGYTDMKSRAVEDGEIDGLKYLILESPGMVRGTGGGGLNGYILFPNRPVKTPGYDGILVYVPVHGGITYASEDQDGMLYGFDTCHCDSENFPRLDHNWIKSQIDVMARGIILAATLEEEYLLAEGDNRKRAEIAQKLLAVQPDQPPNFLTCLRLLSGDL